MTTAMITMVMATTTNIKMTITMVMTTMMITMV